MRRWLGTWDEKEIRDECTAWWNFYTFISIDGEELLCLERGNGSCLQWVTTRKEPDVNGVTCLLFVGIMEGNRKKTRGRIIDRGNFLRIMG